MDLFNILAEKIVKTLALIYCVNDFKVVPPSWDIISEIYSVNYSVGEIESAKEVLKNCHLLIELMYRPYVRITAGSGHNVLELIQQEMFRIDNGLAVKTIFNDICTKKYLYPVNNDETKLIEVVARILFNLRMSDFTDEIMNTFIEELKSVKDAILQYDSDKRRANTASYKIVFRDDNGQEITRQFDSAENTTEGDMLYNALTSDLEEFNESISSDEKRQILFKILKELI